MRVLLPRGADGRAADDYAKLLATAKLRLGDTELRYGGLSPVLPLIASNSSRLFAQYFNGGQLILASSVRSVGEVCIEALQGAEEFVRCG